ncbi:SDR family NAD(P)-dependent oxidoreductase [Pseudooceanicola sp. GBMRC 2024]|uniref:SDR family NAD(P)-dependent oxidoreductase n=1 Tax=Pseudooceanicola albus TaxID=2692189 RepID=A0A6L7G331_9RHOB|nr:SDR family NAD(P)-dependent oxidoreductase [Pseudooceanicola albus]MXN17877.1 SDR family NAD(P)-dependent oxidoreductase [Pseudooceanicola albus]
MPTALVTGATHGTGRALATALAGAGWRVHALGRDRLVLNELRASHGILPMQTDLTDRDQLRSLTEPLEIDALVHAALRLPAAARFGDLTEAEIDMALEVNLSATLHLSRALLPGLAARRGDLVIALPEGPGPLVPLLHAALTAFADALRTEVPPGTPHLHTLPCAPSPEVAGQRLRRMLSAATPKETKRRLSQ